MGLKHTAIAAAAAGLVGSLVMNTDNIITSWESHKAGETVREAAENVTEAANTRANRAYDAARWAALRNATIDLHHAGRLRPNTFFRHEFRFTYPEGSRAGRTFVQRQNLLVLNAENILNSRGGTDLCVRFDNDVDGATRTNPNYEGDYYRTALSYMRAHPRDSAAIADFRAKARDASDYYLCVTPQQYRNRIASYRPAAPTP